MLQSRFVAAILVVAMGTTTLPAFERSAPAQVSTAVPFAIFPILMSREGGFIGLSFVNTGSVPNRVTVTWIGSDGFPVRSGSLTLAPAAQRAALLSEILEISDEPTGGWIRVESTEPGLLSYLATGEEGILDGSEPASTISSKIILPHVSVNTGFQELEHTDTLVELINPGPVAADTRADLFGLDGAVVGAVSLSVPAGGSIAMRISDAFRDVLPSNDAGGRIFRGHIRVSSDAGLAAWMCVEKPLSRGLLRGRGVEEIAEAREAIVSHFAYGSPALYLSELNLINAGDAVITLDITAQDDQGRTIGETARRTLKPGENLREDVFNLFRIVVPEIYPPPLVTGYIRTRAVDGNVFQLTGDIQITCQSYATMFYPIGSAFPSQVVIPFVLADADYFTGYALANPNEVLAVQTDVTIEVFDREGRLVGAPRIVSLSPAARFASLVEEEIRSGYIRILSDMPIAVLGAIGSWNSSTLAPLPVWSLE